MVERNSVSKILAAVGTHVNPEQQIAFDQYSTLVLLTRRGSGQIGERLGSWEERKGDGQGILAANILRTEGSRLGPAAEAQSRIAEFDSELAGKVTEVFARAALQIVDEQGIIGRHRAGEILEERAARKD